MNKNKLSAVLAASLLSPFAFAQEATEEFKPTITPFGDVRSRYEQSHEENASVEDYENTKLRARFGLKAQPTQDVNVEIRVATGTGRTSTNQTVGANSGSTNPSIGLDRAFFKYTAIENLTLTAGRMGNPFTSVGDNDLLWDTDLNFDGHMAAYQHKMDTLSLFANMGIFTIDNSGGTGEGKNNIHMTSAQLGARMSFGEKMSGALVISNHMFGDLEDKGSIVTCSSSNTFCGNSNDGATYNENFNVLAPGIELTYNTSVPVTVFYELVTNSDANENETGFIAGVKLNKLKDKGDWMFTFDMRELEADSTVGAFTDGDSWSGGGTNGKGMKVAAGYMVNKSLSFAAAHYSGEVNLKSGEVATDRSRTQIDLSVKF